MKLSEMRECLAREDIRLTRSLGQNFLHDGNQLRRIVDAAELTRADKVLEIGPGLGPLTEMLLERAGEVLAIEKDKRLVEVLKKRFGCDPGNLAEGSASSQLKNAPGEGTGPARHMEFPGNPVGRVPSRGVSRVFQQPASLPGSEKRGALTLLCADALEDPREEDQDWREWKLVSNLPYSSASPMLVELAKGERSPSRMVATLQLEVAKRLAADAGTAEYGILTLLVQLDFEPGPWFKIPAGCFFPEPEVDSACVVLVRRPRPLLPAGLRADFVRVVKRAFSQRRKIMLKLLKSDWPEAVLLRAYEELGLDAKVRAERLGLEQYVRLTEMLSAPLMGH